MKGSKYIFIISIFIFSSIANVVYSKPVQAVSAGEWIAGRIIDDEVFTNKNAMSVAQVQSFLNSKVGTGGYGKVAGMCDTSGSTITADSGGVTRAQYGESKGNPAPFTCLKDYYEVPKVNPGPGIPSSNYGGLPIPSGAKSSAQLIWDAAQRYNISPQVLLVLIQKESAGPLITDDWPLKRQYTYAMGAYCDDTSPCDENYAGFSIQVSESARLFRYYLDNMGQPWWTNKRPGNNNILWNVAPSGCGGANVNIENKATAALYTYTPYQPNQAALNNMYGTGDKCSAYGNRNFWRMYNDWFGSTVGCNPMDPSYIYRLFRASDNGYLYTQNPAEICQATKYYGYVIEGPITRNNVGAADPGARSMFRLSRNGVYIFTTEPVERDMAMQLYGYRYEGVGYYVSADSTGRYPVHRLSKNGRYVFTVSEYEKTSFQYAGFKYEGTPYYANSEGEKIPIFRVSKNGQHLYTSSRAEKDYAVLMLGYSDEGIAFYGLSGQTGDNLIVYRLNRDKSYLNTVFTDEKYAALNAQYKQQTSYFFAYPPDYSGTVAIYRLSNAKNGDYLLTSNPAERDLAVQLYGYRYEGVGFNGLNP